MVMAAALSLAACDMLGMGRSPEEEGESNQAAAQEETKDGNSSRNDEATGDRASRDGEGGSRDNEESSDMGSRGGGEDSGSSAGSADEEQLNREILAAVRGQRARLPLREGPGTVTDMEAEGSQLVVIMRLDEDFSRADWDEMGAALQRNLCSDRGARRMIGRGASILYRVTDADGERASFTTNRCD